MKGIFYGDGGQLVAEIIDLVVGFIWAWGVMYVLFLIVKRFVKVRVAPEVEIVGLDEAEFGQVCYPEFVIHAETDSGITHELDANGGVRAPAGADVGSDRT